MQVVLFEVEEQLDPQIDADGWYASHIDGKTCTAGELPVDIVIVLRGQSQLPHVIDACKRADAVRARRLHGGQQQATSTAMIAITTSSSISVIRCRFQLLTTLSLSKGNSTRVKQYRFLDAMNGDIGHLTSVTY